MNSSYFEAFALTIRDFPDRYPYWGTDPFVNGVAGTVPRALWPDKPSEVAVGASFRQIYEPETLNGWPIGGAGEWFLAFGPIGLAVGALLTGAALATVGRTMARRAALPYAAAFGLQVFELGVNGQTVLRWVGWILPASLMTLAFVSAGRRRRSNRASHRPVTPSVAAGPSP